MNMELSCKLFRSGVQLWLIAFRLQRWKYGWRQKKKCWLSDTHVLFLWQCTAGVLMTLTLCSWDVLIYSFQSLVVGLKRKNYNANKLACAQHVYTYTCLWLKWFASYKTRESSTGVRKFEWLCWLAAMTSENVRSCKAAKNSHFCCLLVFSKQLKESTCWALLLSKLPDRRLITPVLVVLMYKKKILHVFCSFYSWWWW